MINFRDYLNEIFDSQYEVKLYKTTRSADRIFYQYLFDDDDGNHIEVDVIVYPNGRKIVPLFTTNDRMAITGTNKSAAKIFSTVIKIVKIHAVRHPNYFVGFTGGLNAPSRVKLYEALARRLANELGRTLEIVNHPTAKDFIIK
jgi:hypothetical protein